MASLAFPSVMRSPTVSLREAADKLLKSCKRKPVDVGRWAKWRAGERDLSFEMIDNALLAGGKREYARALYLQKAAELIDPVDDSVPQMTECQRMAVEADVASDHARQMALLDGEITLEEARRIEATHTEEVKVIDLLLERLRRSRNYLSARIG